MHLNQSIFWGGDPPNFLEFYVPLPTPFYCIFKKEFSKIFKIWSFMSSNFSRKISQNFPKISWNFLNFFKIEKNYYYCTQNSPKSLYLPKFGQILSLKLQKNFRFFNKNTKFFKIFAAFGGEICASFMVFQSKILCLRPDPIGRGLTPWPPMLSMGPVPG